MAILFMEGFDGWATHGNTSNLAELVQRGMYATGGGWSLKAGGRVGGRHLLAEGYYTLLLQPIGVSPAALTQVVVGGAFLPAFGTPTVIYLVDVNEVPLSITRTFASGTISVTYNPSGTGNDISTTYSTLPTVWSFIEVSWTPTKVRVWVDGVKIVDKVGTFPALRTLAPISYGAGGNSPCGLDDLYVTDDAEPLGEVYIKSLPLGTDVALTGTVTGGATAAGVWPSFDNATSYVNLATVGELAAVTVGDITDNPSTIHAVQVTSSTNKTDVGAAKFDVKLKTASENTVDSVTPITDWAGYRSIVELDPHDSAAWTKAKVNSLEVGLTRVTP